MLRCFNKLVKITHGTERSTAPSKIQGASVIYSTDSFSTVRHIVCLLFSQMTHSLHRATRCVSVV